MPVSLALFLLFGFTITAAAEDANVLSFRVSRLQYDPAKETGPGKWDLVHKNPGVHGSFVADATEIALDPLVNLAFMRMRAADDKAVMVSQVDRRLSSRQPAKVVQFSAVSDGTPLTFLGIYWGGFGGSSQVLVFTTPGLFAEYRSDFDELFTGLSAKAPVRVGGPVLKTRLVHQVSPVYPTAARKQHIQGVVRFSAAIARDGTIKSLTLISGDPLLAPAAYDAVKQWRYSPTLLEGKPVEVLTTLEVTFALDHP